LSDERVLIAGAGPVGLVAAAHLARAGVPVTVFEQGAALSEESRASTFHPPTLDMLDRLGVAKPLIAEGLIARADASLDYFDYCLASAAAHAV